MIEINNLTRFRINKIFLKKIAKIVLEGERTTDIDLSIALVSQADIGKINKEYRGKDKVTDVLSFPDINEIIICPSEIKRNSQRFNSSFKKESARALIHGILHLLKYNHEKGK